MFSNIALCRIKIIEFRFREFLFPQDLQIDLESWSESAEYTQDELHEVSDSLKYVDVETRTMIVVTVNVGVWDDSNL